MGQKHNIIPLQLFVLGIIKSNKIKVLNAGLLTGTVDQNTTESGEFELSIKE